MPKLSIILLVNRSRLNLKAGEIQQGIAVIDVQSSLELASNRMATEETAVIAVCDDGKFVGVLTDKEFLRAFAEAKTADSDLATLVTQGLRVPPYVSGADVLRRLVDGGHDYAVVVDDDDRVKGLIRAASFVNVQGSGPKPAMVGGMATPLGVYLTNGAISGGAKQWALILTGFYMFCMFLLGRLSVLAIYKIATVQEIVIPQPAMYAIELLPILVLLASFRVLPISSIHGAEHMVVHAIEREELLVPEVVSRMPRVHPRCGTNIAVAASLFLGISETPWLPWPEVRLLVAMLAAIFFWRPLGSFVQQYITTKAPRSKDIESAIRAANELLYAYQVSPRSDVNPFVRIWNSGMLHVMGGSLLCYGVFYLVAWILGFDASGV